MSLLRCGKRAGLFLTGNDFWDRTPLRTASARRNVWVKMVAEGEHNGGAAIFINGAHHWREN